MIRTNRSLPHFYQEGPQLLETLWYHPLPEDHPYHGKLHARGPEGQLRVPLKSTHPPGYAQEQDDKLRNFQDKYQAKYREARIIEVHQYPQNQGLGATKGSQTNKVVRFSHAGSRTQPGVPGVDRGSPKSPPGVERTVVEGAPKEGESRNKNGEVSGDPKEGGTN